MAGRKQTLSGIFHEGLIEGIWIFRANDFPFLKCCMRLIATRVNDVTNYFSLFVELRLKLSTGISDARATQLCRSSVGTTVNQSVIWVFVWSWNSIENNRRFSAKNALKWKYSLKTLPAVCLLCFYCFSELLEADLGDFLLKGRHTRRD